MSDKQIVDMLVSVQTEYVPKSEVVRLNAEVERLTRELDNARAWSARWKAVAIRLWPGVHHPLDMCESEARRREAAERERDALAAQVARLREAGSVLAEYVEHQPYSLARMTAIEAWRAALAAPTSGEADADH